MIYLLLISLIILLIISFYLNDKSISAPSIIFTFGFVFQAIWASFYKVKWDLNLNIRTFLVIFIGVLEFLIVSFIVQHLVKMRRKDNALEKKKINVIKICKNKEVVFLITGIVISLAFLYCVVLCVNGSFSSFNSIIHAISNFNDITKFSNYTEVRIPFVVNNLQVFVIASGYWFLYVIINNYIAEKKIKIIEILIVINSLICSTLSGSRTNFVMILIAGICFYLIIRSRCKDTNKILNKKLIMIAACLSIVFLLLFPSFAKLLGRKLKSNSIDYLSIYCGAEIKNLDLILPQLDTMEKNNIWGSQTFYSMIGSIGQKIGFEGYKKYQLDLPFQSVNGYDLGNVYTTFYPYIYDFGYIGAVILVCIMAIISQYTYYKAKTVKESTSYSNIWILIYGNVFCCLLLSFFSNKFYENIISMNFIKYIIFWIFLNFVLIKAEGRPIRLTSSIVNNTKNINKEIKILYITPALNNCGGIESFVMSYYTNFTSNIKADFITHDIKDNTYKKIIEERGGKVFLLKPFNLKNIFIVHKEIQRFFEKHHDYDIVHCNMANAAYVYLKYAKKYGIRVRIQHSHQNKYADTKTHAFRNFFLIKYGNMFANVNFACSKLAGDFLFRNKTYYIVNNAINIKKYAFNSKKRKNIRRKLNIKDNVVLLGNVGRLCEQKNQIKLVKIMNYLVNIQKCNYKLVIVGDGILYEKLLDETKRMNLMNNIIFVGSVNNVEDYLSAMDIFVLPSLYEGLGIVNIESQSSGLPTIVSDKVPSDIDITNLVKFIKLSDNDCLWGNIIINTKNNSDRSNNNYISLIKSAGYDIYEETKKLEKLYYDLAYKEKINE